MKINFAVNNKPPVYDQRKTVPQMRTEILIIFWEFYLPESIRDLIIESLIWRDENVFCNEISSKDFMIVDFYVDLSCPSDRWSTILSI